MTTFNYPYHIKKLLLVEDNINIVLDVRDILKDAVQASEVLLLWEDYREEALAVLEKEGPSLCAVITDNTLHGEVSATEIARAAINQGIKNVVIHSAESENQIEIPSGVTYWRKGESLKERLANLLEIIL